MNIRIGDFSIEHQCHNNVTVFKHGIASKGESKGQPTQTVVGYYASTKSALCAVLECNISPLDVVSISGVIEAINKAKAEIITAVKNAEAKEGE